MTARFGQRAGPAAARAGEAAMILYTYNPLLVVLSVVIALMSSFTGLSLTRGLSSVPVGPRQFRIAMAAVALGGGIWSMHFVAMLAMRFDVPVYYEVIETVASALIAILLSGTALLIMHFVSRARGAIAAAGGILGIGIVAMHYVGLSATEGCQPVYGPAGVLVAGVLAIGMGIAAMAIAYGRRSERNILLATLVFGLAVAVVHFTAMSFTTYAVAPLAETFTPVMAHAQVAVIVLVSAFVISGAFLLSGAGFMNRQMVVAGGAPLGPALVPAVAETAPVPDRRIVAEDPARRLPYERDGRTCLVPFDRVRAIRADGHYTTAWLDREAVFCPWSITAAEERVPQGFLRVHRSWLVNLSHVTAFERTKDHGYCVIGGEAGPGRVPVARARIGAVREALGL